MGWSRGGGILNAVITNSKTMVGPNRVLLIESVIEELEDLDYDTWDDVAGMDPVVDKILTKRGHLVSAPEGVDEVRLYADPLLDERLVDLGLISNDQLDIPEVGDLVYSLGGIEIDLEVNWDEGLIEIVGICDQALIQPVRFYA